MSAIITTPSLLYEALTTIIPNLPRNARKIVIECEVDCMPMVTVTMPAKAGSMIEPTVTFRLEEIVDGNDS